MDKTDAQQIEELKDRIAALQQLTLALAVASARRDRAVFPILRRYANSQIDAAGAQHRDELAVRLQVLLEDVEQCLA